MFMKDKVPFNDYLFNYFLEWEKTQKAKRSSISAFARWLSQNSFGTEINRQLVNYWISGKIPTNEKYVLVLSEKLGAEIYEVLDKEKPNENVVYVQTRIENLDADEIKKIRDQVEKYIVNKKEK